MKRVVCLLLCAVMLLGLLPAAALADAPQDTSAQESEPEISVQDSADTEPGEPVLLEGVTLKDENYPELYLGIGRLLGNDVELVRNNSFTAPSTGTQKVTYSVMLWQKANGEYSFVGANHYNSKKIDGWDELSNITLSEPRSMTDNANAPSWRAYTGDYGQTNYEFGFDSTTTGKWEITASCTLGGKTYQVSCYVTVQASADPEPGEPVLLEGFMLKEGDNPQLYLGIGRFLDNDDVELARDDSFTAPRTGTQEEIYSAIFWQKVDGKYYRVGVEHYNSDEIEGWEKLAGMTLVTPSGANAPTLGSFVDKNGWTEYKLGFDSTNTGRWQIIATCSLGGVEYEVSCYVTVQAPADPEPGEPVKLDGVTINGSQLYLGIGRFLDDDVELVRNSTAIVISGERNWATYAVILWTKGDNGYQRVGTNHYNSNDIDGWDLLSDVTLSTPHSTTDSTKELEWERISGVDWKDYAFVLESAKIDKWEITASFKLNGTEYEVSCYVTVKAAAEKTIESSEVDTLEKLNAKLAEIIQEDSTEPQWYYINLPAQTYEGTVVIPAEGTNSDRKIVYLEGCWDSNGNQTTIKGGIRSDNDLLYARRIRFTGAGRATETLTDGTTPNSALYGSGKVDSEGCTFEEYDKAVVWEGNRRLFGRVNTYKNNNIAWYVDLSNGDASGETEGYRTTFENNSCALYVKSMGNLEYTGEITDYTGKNVFRNNTTDIRNDSGRPWFMTRSYFVQTDDDGNETRDLKYSTSHLGVSCYPMLKSDDGTETFYYDYKQNGQDAQSYLISNYDASRYRTPAANLDGKTFEVIDPVRMTQLALFSFPSNAESVDTTQTEFDATVWVNRSDDQIVLTMNNPGRRVYVKVPCDASSGTITHNGQTVAESGFDGYSAWFWTSEGGEYVITMGGAKLGRVTGCATVEEINAALEKEFAAARLGEYREQGISTILVQLSASEYTGQIVVPALPEGFQDFWITVVFQGTYSNNANNVTIYGGISSSSETVYVFAEMLNFVGAGKDNDGKYLEKWPETSENKGAENAALYGNSGGGQADCNFTGYYCAVKLTKGMRPCGVNNTYTQNHIAWYIGEGNTYGGNNDAKFCNFNGNDIAIQATNFRQGPSAFILQNCRFIDNAVDVENTSGRTWCIPGNYFAHSDSDGNVVPKIIVEANEASPVSCFPMYDRDSEQYYYEYEPAETTHIISNNLANNYPIPQEKLNNKTLKIVDEDADQTLVTLSFDDSESTDRAFPASVRVERVGSTISFAMSSSGRPITVELPCAFTDGTVTGSAAGDVTAKFDGKTVKFTTDYGDVYTIKSTSDAEDKKFEPGVPKPITVTIDGKEKTCYFGVGEFINGRYTVLTGSYIGAMSIEDAVPRLAVGLWWKNSSGEFTMLSRDEAAQVQKQADFSLEFRPLSAAPVDPPAWEQPDDEELATKMPAAGWYRMKARHEGTWRVVATCKMNGQTYTACGEFERGIINRIDVTGCTTVALVNEAVQNKLNELASSDTLRRTTIRIVMEAAEYTGQIVVPDVPSNIKNTVDVEFLGYNPSEGVTLHGGISSTSTGIWASNITFIGAGKENRNWPADGENKGAENAALFGNGYGSADGCVFIGYDYAMKMTGGMRLCGTYNTFRENHIAWYVGDHDGNGGNPNAELCVFEKNDIAIQIEEFSDYLPMSFYAPGRCEFIDNKLDVQLNQEKIGNRMWFIPGNYFAQTDENGDKQLETRISPATSVSFYPVRVGDQLIYDGVEWGATNGILLSNSLTSAYPTPQAYLDGKTFKVIDEDNTTTLATFSFPEQTQTQARIALFAAEADAFDATVYVERTDDQIVFAMNDPCKPATVTLPCAFENGTVMHNGQVVADAAFDGKTVSFESSEGGTYEIHASTHVIAAGYNTLGQLVGVKILTSADARADIKGASKIKIFILDSSYRPIAEVRTQTK